MFFLISVLIFAGIFVFFPQSEKKDTLAPAVSSQPEAKAENAAPTQAQNNKAASKNYSESSEKYKYQISINYPAFQDIADKKITDAINAQIETKVQAEIDKYIAEARRNKISPNFGYFTGNYEYSVTPENVLSVKIEGQKYLSGAASAQDFSFSISFDLASGKQI